jgi:hypothetical protein
VNDIDLTLPDDVVLRLSVCPQPPEPEEQLPRCECLVIYLPDREVWIASTCSSTASANEPRVTPEEARHDDDECAATKPHPRTIAQPQRVFERKLHSLTTKF